MRDETVRLVTSAIAIGIGLVFVASGLTLLNAGTETDPAYRQAGMLLLPGGTIDCRGGGPLAFACAT